jgi:hypothetical protein
VHRFLALWRGRAFSIFPREVAFFAHTPTRAPATRRRSTGTWERLGEDHMCATFLDGLGLVLFTPFRFLFVVTSSDYY